MLRSYFGVGSHDEVTMVREMRLLVLAVGSLCLVGCEQGEPERVTEAGGSIGVAAPAVGTESGPLVDESAVDELPVRVSGADIEYPDELRHEGVEGHVLLSAVVGVDGSVEERSVTVDSATHAEFEAAAVAWLEGATFTPGTVDGGTVRVRIKLPVAFRLDR
jgi:TonB family protein